VAAIMRIVTGVGGSTVLDLNAAAGGGVMNGRGDKVLAQTTLTDEGIGDVRGWWQPSPNPVEVASRTISIPLKVQGASQDDKAARVAALVAATSRPWILEVRRHGASTSGWIRCQPARLLPVDNPNGAGASLFADVTLTAAAEPYAVGAMVDLGSLSWNQDPINATALYQDITVAQGDSLAPCLIRVPLSSLVGAGLTTHGSLWAVRRRGTPANLTASLTVQGEASVATSGTANVSFSTVTGDAALSGSQARRVTFGGSYVPTNYGDVEYQFSPDTAEAPGQYRLIARLRRGGGGAGVEHSVIPLVGPYTLPRVKWLAGVVDTRVLDLGIIQVPIGQPPTVSAPVNVTVRAAAERIVLRVAKAAGTGGTLDIDWVALVPADADMGHWRVAQTAASSWAFADGYSGDTGFTDVDLAGGGSPVLTGLGPTASTLWTGGVIRLRPGTNRVWCVQGLTGAALWPKGTPMVASVAYWPRYRWLP
jgi:hypothetical protein